MDVRGLQWVGVRTSRFDEMRGFLGDAFGLPLIFERPQQIVFEMPNGNPFEVFGPGDDEHLRFGTKPCVGYAVGDVEATRAEMEAAGVRFLRPTEGDEGGRYAHFLGPDGGPYEITNEYGPSDEAAAGSTRALATGLAWVGIATERFDETVAFCEGVLGLSRSFATRAIVGYELTSGDVVELFGPGTRYFDFYAEHASGPVPGFSVADVDAARDSLGAAGVELVGDVERMGDSTWCHVRGPDGNLYQLLATTDP